MTEMKNAVVTHISLVDRSSSRMPIRILKKETDMLDLSKIGGTLTTKSEPDTPLAEVCAVFVFKQDTPEGEARVKQAIVDAGFSVDNPLPVEGSESVIAFSQKQEDPLKDTLLVRLNEQIAIAVKGFQPQHPDMEKADFSEDAASKGFYPSIDRSLDTLFNKICTSLHSAADQADAVKQITSLCDGFKSYAVDLVKKLPQAAFKMEGNILKAIEEVEVAKREKADAEAKELAQKAEAEAADKAAKELIAKAETTMTKPDDVKQEDWDAMSDEDKAKACKKETVDPPVPAVKLEDVLAAVTALTTKVDGVASKQVELATQQGELQNKVDAVTQKAETVSQLVSSTVTAAPPPGDMIPGTTKKGDKADEMGTGLFDSVLQGKAKKYDKLMAGSN